MYRRITRSTLAILAAVWFAPEHGALAPSSTVWAQGPAGVTRFEIAPGTRVLYRVKEQLVGISFLNDAVGVSEGVKGALTVRADGSVDPSTSRLTLDLQTFKSDQDRRDNFIRRRVFEVEKFPEAVFVARRTEGSPLPDPASKLPFPIVGFKLIGDLTMHGVTKEVAFDVVATYNQEGQLVEGKAMTTIPFAMFNLTKPALPFLLTVEDNIQLEIDFKAKTSNVAS
jgi:polyisoprenoid-binding protein YceI